MNYAAHTRFASETQPQTETCNNKDDDCDGAIDEDLTRPCGNSFCPGSEICSAGVWGTCNAQQPQTEIEGNHIGGKLTCSGNTPAPSNDGHANTVPNAREGQTCANGTF